MFMKTISSISNSTASTICATLKELEGRTGHAFVEEIVSREVFHDPANIAVAHLTLPSENESPSLLKSVPRYVHWRRFENCIPIEPAARYTPRSGKRQQ